MMLEPYYLSCEEHVEMGRTSNLEEMLVYNGQVTIGCAENNGFVGGAVLGLVGSEATVDYFVGQPFFTILFGMQGTVAGGLGGRKLASTYV